MIEILSAVAALLMMQGQEPKPEPPKPQGLVVESGDWKIKFYGFARLDLQYDDSKPNDPQLPQFIRSEDGTVSANTAKSGDAQFNMHPKLTRFGCMLNCASPLLAVLAETVPSSERMNWGSWGSFGLESSYCRSRRANP